MQGFLVGKFVRQEENGTGQLGRNAQTEEGGWAWLPKLQMFQLSSSCQARLALFTSARESCNPSVKSKVLFQELFLGGKKGVSSKLYLAEPSKGEGAVEGRLRLEGGKWNQDQNMEG